MIGLSTANKYAILVVWCFAALATGCTFPAISGFGASKARQGEIDDGLSIAEINWLAPEADIVQFMTQTPGECLSHSSDPETQYLIEVGRAAFRSPLLFGGLAARDDLSCNSCHRDGRDNPAFFIAGLSGEPGTADVTSAIFSKIRGDGVFNPIAIPDLVGISGKPTFGTRAPVETLHAFVESAVVDEFQGTPPPPAIVAGVAQYVAHLSDDSCPTGVTMRSPGGDIADSARAGEAARSAIQQGDLEVADFMILSAQYGLGRIHERYPGDRFSGQRQALESLAGEFKAVRIMVKTDPGRAGELLGSALSQLTEVEKDLFQHQRGSLYDIDALTAALDVEE